MAVGVDQQSQQHGWRKRRLAGTAHLARRLEPAQVHQLDRIDHKMNDAVLGKPVHHIDRQQDLLLATVRFAEKMSHDPIPISGVPHAQRIRERPRLELTNG